MKLNEIVDKELLIKEIPEIVSCELRFKIFAYFLARYRKYGKPHSDYVSRICDRLDVPRSTLRYQLRYLVRKRVLEEHKSGNKHWYRLNTQNIEFLKELAKSFSKEYKVSL